MSEEKLKDVKQAQEGTAKSPKSAQVEESHDAYIQRLERESKELEVALKRAELQDAQDRLAEREMKRITKFERSRINGTTLKQLAHNDFLIQGRCNHHKGGNGAEGVVGGQGDDSQYCVLKHKMSNGDIWVRCLRCGKTWKPPLEDMFETKEGYQGALAEYYAAVNFQTRNVMSTSVAFQWSDGGKFFRETMKNTTLR